MEDCNTTPVPVSTAHSLSAQVNALKDMILSLNEDLANRDSARVNDANKRAKEYDRVIAELLARVKTLETKVG